MWQNASDSAAGKEKESQYLALCIFFPLHKRKSSLIFFLLYLSLLKPPRQLKDIDVESEYPESMWKTILSEDQSENLYFSELCAISWITTSDLRYCLIITKNITCYRMHCVSFDYASRERHGIQRENKGRMMAVYWLINLHLSTVNLSPLCCQSCTPTAVIAGIWKSQLWDPCVHSRICTASVGLLLQWLQHPPSAWVLPFEAWCLPLLCSLCATIYTKTVNQHLFSLNCEGKWKKPSGNCKGNKRSCVRWPISGL